MPDHCIRLTRGTDVKAFIEQFAKQHHIQAGVVLTCVGCLKRWRIRGADGESLFDGSRSAEIVSLSGTVSEHGCHLHISLSLDNLMVVGGHLVEGCIVNTTAELILKEIDNTMFTRAYDDDTGYVELVISQTSK